MDDIHWEVQFKHRDKKAGKDRTYIVSEKPNNSIGALNKAMERAEGDNLVMNGEFRTYVYVLDK